MKIIYCIAGTYNSGGMERVLANKANYLVTQGYQLTIVTTDQQGRNPYFELNNNIHQIDLDINYSSNQEAGLLKKVVNYKKKQVLHRKRLETLLIRQRADIVISMFDHEVSFLFKIQDGSKKIVEIHFSRFKRLQYGRTGLWKRVDCYRSKQDLKWVKQYDRFIVLTHEDSKYWGDLNNIRVIPNANSFVPKSQSTCTHSRAIAVGRYDYQKGFDDLIAAWKGVFEKYPDWQLYIFGDGELREAMLSQIEKFGLTNVVHLRKPVKDIENEYIDSSFLVMSSRYEGLPMTLLEAQVCGLPMVAYACKCGPLDIIDDGVNGYLVSQGDQEQLTNRMINMIENSVKRADMGKEAHKMSANFSIDRIMKQWMDLFKEIKEER